MQTLQLRWHSKQSFSLHWELSNGMLHATCMEGNPGNSRLLVVGSQIANLIPSPSFGHNFCLKCLNGSCKPILNIYIPKDFQLYKDLLNPMGFDPCNCPLKIWESIGSNSQSGMTRSQVPCWTHLRVQLCRIAESWDLKAAPDFQH